MFIAVLNKQQTVSAVLLEYMCHTHGCVNVMWVFWIRNDCK